MDTSTSWVAVVDDDEHIRRSLLRILDLRDIAAEGFDSGQSFLDALPHGQPACVLLDLHMPDLGGFELCSRLTEWAPEIQIVFITGNDSAENRKRALACDPVAYLPKPVNAQSLFEALTLALQRHEQNAASRNQRHPDSDPPTNPPHSKD